MAKKEKDNKTNVCRILDKEKVDYTFQTYECDEFIDGVHTADVLGLAHELVYKTLVTCGSSKQYFVFVIPIEAELDMKAAARAVGEKSIAMLPVKDITAVTGYVRGGCTAIGMKKQFVTRIDESAKQLPQMYVSAGKRGAQICLAPEDLARVSRAEFAPVIMK